MSPEAEFARLVREGGRGALITVIEEPEEGSGPSDHEPRVGAKLLVRADGAREGALGSPELEAASIQAAEELMWEERSVRRELTGWTVFIDVAAPAPRLLLFGAVDFARAVCRVAETIGWRPAVCDPRSRFATPERFPEAERVIAAWPREAFAELGGIDRSDSIVVLTHDPKLDDAALTIALRSEARFVGAMGSRRAQARRRERLLAAGLSAEQLDRLAAPVGLDLGGLSPGETALSIVAEVVATRNGRDGGRLSKESGRIHAVGS